MHVRVAQTTRGSPVRARARASAPAPAIRPSRRSRRRDACARSTRTARSAHRRQAAHETHPTGPSRQPDPFIALAWTVVEQKILFSGRRRSTARSSSGWAAGSRERAGSRRRRRAGAATSPRLQSFGLGARGRALCTAPRCEASGSHRLGPPPTTRRPGACAISGIGPWTVGGNCVAGQGATRSRPATWGCSGSSAAAATRPARRRTESAPPPTAWKGLASLVAMSPGRPRQRRPAAPLAA